MSHLKLFQIAGNKIEELEGRSATLQESIQTFMEKHLDKFLGVRSLANVGACWHLLVNKVCDGGTLVTVSAIADIENALPLVRRVHELARA